MLLLLVLLKRLFRSTFSLSLFFSFPKGSFHLDIVDRRRLSVSPFLPLPLSCVLSVSHVRFVRVSAAAAATAAILLVGSFAIDL